jgi:hypothetical protein
MNQVKTKDELVAMTSNELTNMFSGNKSATIRYLTGVGHFSTGQIAKMLDIRYQFVRNVQKAPVSKK